VDVVGGEWVRGFWGLTCDFWAKTAKNRCKGKKQQQIPFGDDKKGETTARDNR
jgi:hypothetical protein